MQGFAPGCSHAGALMRESGPHRTVVNSQLIAVANLWQEYDSVQNYQLLRHESVCVSEALARSLAHKTTTYILSSALPPATVSLITKLACPI